MCVIPVRVTPRTVHAIVWPVLSAMSSTHVTVADSPALVMAPANVIPAGSVAQVRLTVSAVPGHHGNRCNHRIITVESIIYAEIHLH